MHSCERFDHSLKPSRDFKIWNHLDNKETYETETTVVVDPI
jgi:hypothetical protein